LQIKKSDYVVSKTGKSIGWGLFSKTQGIEKGNIISMYIGERVSNEVWHDRVASGKGGYGVYVNKTTVQDCRESFRTKNCFASAVNCSINLCHKITNKKATHNAYMIINSGYAYLRSETYIPPNTEIFVEKYASNYRFLSTSLLVHEFF